MKSGIDSIYKSSGFESHRKDNRKYIWRIYIWLFSVMFSTTSVQNFLICRGGRVGKLKCFEDKNLFIKFGYNTLIW